MPKGLMDERGYVLFGDELNEKALNALKRNSPTADVILKAIPKEAFIQAELEEKGPEILKRYDPRQELKKSIHRGGTGNLGLDDLTAKINDPQQLYIS